MGISFGSISHYLVRYRTKAIKKWKPREDKNAALRELSGIGKEN
jgi:hypothetical protein